MFTLDGRVAFFSRTAAASCDPRCFALPANRSMNFPPAVAGLLLLVLGPLAALAGPPLREGFETPEISGRDAGGDGNHKIVAHERTTSGAHSGQGCERVQVSGDSSTYVYLSHEIGQARVISELSASVWLKADRPGMQILLRVVLPR